MSDAGDTARRGAAAEVLELGEALFDSLIEAAATPAARDPATAAFPVGEVSEAARQFFLALRLLLNLEEP